MRLVWQDVRYSWRRLMNAPGFTAVATLMLGLGIGTNTAIFSLISNIFLRPLPVPDAHELVVVTFKQGNAAPSFFSYPDLQDIRKETDKSAELLAYSVGMDSLSVDGHAERILTSYVTGNYFSALGLKPAAGRLILPSEERLSGNDPVLVLGYDYWKSRFNGDPGVIGKAVLLDGHQFVVIGVAPAHFRGLFSIARMQAYMPLDMETVSGLLAGKPWEDRGARNLYVAGRLKPDVTPAKLQALLDVTASHLEQQFPQTDRSITMRVFEERQQRLQPNPQAGQYNTEVMVAALFFALSGLVFLLACVNITNILLVRTIARQREIATRLALGAKFARVFRPIITESLILAILGAMSGIVIGELARAAIAAIRLPASLPIRLDFDFDWQVFVFAIVVAVLAGVLMGIIPAIKATRVDVNKQLHESGRGYSSRRQFVRNSLVVAQLSGSLVILIMAGLFTRSLQQMQHLDLGFNPAHVLNFSMDPQQSGYDEVRSRALYKDLLIRVRSLPGVKSASMVFAIPTSIYRVNGAVYIEGHDLAPGQQPPIVTFNMASPDYFKTLDMSLLRGRAFTEDDENDKPGVAVINETMAKQLWPNEDALGKRFKLTSAPSPWTQVVGVVHDSKTSSILEAPHSYFYLPLAQQFIALETLQVRFTGSSESEISNSVIQQVHQIDSNLPVFDAQTMNEALNGSGGFFIFRLGSNVAWTLGILGLILAVVGIYGVTSYAVAQQSFDIGVRMALGAQRQHIRRMVLRQGLIVIAIGIAVGLVGAVAAINSVKTLFARVGAFDPLTFAFATLLLVVIALGACYVPARRAMRVDPLVVLHLE